jgi:hypothetical protein
MILKKLFLALILLATGVVFAQEGTSSPYSFYGLGDIKFKGTPDVRAMGGLGIAYDSIHINLLNPASYSKLKITNFVVGGTTTFNDFSNEQTREKAKRTSLDYLALGLPLGKKFGASFGLMPFTSVGYKVQQINPEDESRSSRYNGSGGINRAFLGLGYNINDNLSVGADFQYNFGNIDTETVVFIQDVILGSREKNSSNIKGISSNFAVLYNRKLTNKLNLVSSIRYAPQARLNSINQRNIGTVSYSSSGIQIVHGNQDINVNDTKLVIPSKYVFGSGIGEAKKWFIGAEYTFQENSNLGNRFDDIKNVVFENSQKIVIGGYFIPKYNSFTSYWSRINYRAGLRYENTGLVINSKAINDYGINFGLGLPVGGTFSNINLGFEYGKKGTIYNNLVEENYFNISVGLSLNAVWFEKRKYD